MSKLKILVVSHERTIADYITDFLQSSGYEVKTEKSSTAAIHKVRKVAPNLLVIDPVMPGLSGIDAALRISRMTKCGVLFLTTAANNSTFRDTLQVLRGKGCECRAISLPFEKSNLLRKLRLLAVATRRNRPLAEA